MAEEGGRLLATYEYNTDLFDEATIRRLADSFKVLLAAATDSPERPVSQLPVLSQSEREKLLLQWNAERARYSTRLVIHEMFEQQVERTPDQVAVGFQGEQLAYRELNRRANLLAHHLKKHGAAADRLVGLCLHRGIE